GEEIGMGEDLSLPGRQAIRTPMQWSSGLGGGFSDAPELVRPVVSDGRYGYETVNVAAQRGDPDSLLAWFERMIRTLRESPEVGADGREGDRHDVLAAAGPCAASHRPAVDRRRQETPRRASRGGAQPAC